MSLIDSKPYIERAILNEWSAFAENHPRLAAALDQQMLIEQATAQLTADPEYLKAMDQAAAANLAADSLLALVSRFVRQFLARLGA